MKQLEFEGHHSSFWIAVETVLENLETGKDVDSADFPSSYRKVCQHLAIAKSRRYSPDLISRLNSLVKRGYQSFYGNELRNQGIFFEFVRYGFPAALRGNAKFLWASAAVFVLPFVAMMIACLLNDQVIYSVMDAGNVRMMESMYAPSADKFGRERQSDSDILMFGFYIYNNIGIAFKCFATGLFVGVGSLFMLAYNGIVLGGVSGHLTALGYTQTFYPFVIGHGSFELTAIVFSGAAGLKLGFALLAPGPYSRKVALQIAASDAIKIMYGVFLMLFIAAFIEAFWSSSSFLPIPVKLGVGALLWVLVYYYCFFSSKQQVKAYRQQHAAR